MINFDVTNLLNYSQRCLATESVCRRFNCRRHIGEDITGPVLSRDLGRYPGPTTNATRSAVEIRSAAPMPGDEA